MRLVLDASAILAHLLAEKGGGDSLDVSHELLISSVNLSEVVDYFAREGFARERITKMLEELPIDVIALDEDVAFDAGMMRPDTKEFGLSLGDRCCLALAKKLACPAVTAEQIWPTAGAKLGVEIQLIR